MDNIAVLKTSDYMDNGIHLSNIGQKLVPKSLTLGSTLHQPCDIYKFNSSRNNLLCVIHLAQHPKPLVRHSDHSHVRVNGTERIIGRLCTRLSQRIEQRTFSYIG